MAATSIFMSLVGMGWHEKEEFCQMERITPFVGLDRESSILPNGKVCEEEKHGAS